MRLITLLALPLLAMSASALAAEDPTCRNGLFASERQFALARVRGDDRAYFNGDADGCPWTRGECETDSYVIVDDTVVISRIRNGYACAYYPSKGGGTAGWISTRRLSLFVPEITPPRERWLGTWTSEGNLVLAFSEELGTLQVSGQAFWPGRPGTHDWPSVHIGEIAGPVSVSGHRGTYGEDDNLCEVRFTLLRDYLVASDNRNCGGANVSFSGVYLRGE